MYFITDSQESKGSNLQKALKDLEQVTEYSVNKIFFFFPLHKMFILTKIQIKRKLLTTRVEALFGFLWVLDSIKRVEIEKTVSLLENKTYSECMLAGVVKDTD